MDTAPPMPNAKCLFFSHRPLSLEKVGQQSAALVSQDAGDNFDLMIEAGVGADLIERFDSAGL